MMKRMLAVAIAGAITAHAQTQAGAAGSTAINAEMIESLEAELDRSINKLAVAGEAPPYFVAFKLTEVEVNDVSATMGAPLATKARHFMNLDASVRVGSYEFDNSNFIIPRQEGIDGLASIPLPLEATPRIARKAAWLATDAAFKEALAQYTAKKANLARRATTGAKAPSYSKEAPLVLMDRVEVPPLEDNDALTKQAVAVSAVFRDLAAIRDARVAYTSFLERRWYLNSEGTRTHDVRRVSGVIVAATAQAEDGEIISLYASHYGHTMADLPSTEALKKEAAELAAQLDAMRTAPVLGNYTGPVLFEGPAAAAMTRFTLSPHLSGTPVPDGLPDAQFFGGEFADRVGSRVTNPQLSVFDDPSLSRWKKSALIGGFKFDDEGVRAQRVDVIKNGSLATLLMSRTPSAQIGHSNGHARLPGPGMFYGSATNLIVQGKNPLGRPQLVKKLLAEAKSQGLPFGLLVRRFDDPMITANGEVPPRELADELKGRKPDELPQILLAYRVYPNGKEELVRSVQLRAAPARVWRDVVAVGKDETTVSFLATNDDGTRLRFTGGGPGFVPSAGVESSIVAPDLLFKELDVRRPSASLLPSPVVPRP
jgi:TldD protein